MNSAIEQAILTVGSSWALSTLLKATLVMALGLCTVLLAGRQRAAFRHALLAGTFGVLLALPLVSALAPPFAIVLPPAQARNLATPIAARSGTTPLAAAQNRPLPADSQSAPWSIAGLLAASWIAGIVVSLLPAAAGLRQVLRLRRSGL